MTQRPAQAGQRTTALFDNLSEKLGGILDRLTGRGSLSEADVDAAMREVRRALLEADVSLDIYRPAAMEQLAVLGRDLDIPTLPIVAGQKPAQIAKRALEAGKLGGYDVVLLDTAGRTTLDEEMMSEAAEIKTAANPHEVLLVADSLTGQDAVNLARAFDARVGLTGIVLTRVDGDGRGGAALSMRAVTGKPIKLIGTGEKTDAL